MLLVLTNGTFDVSPETAAQISAALNDETPTITIDLDIFEEGAGSPTLLALRHVVAVIDYKRPEGLVEAIASGKVHSIGR